MRITYKPQPTFLLRWNPEISSCKESDWIRMCKQFPYAETNWSVNEYQLDPKAENRIINLDMFRKHCEDLKFDMTDDNVTHDSANIYCNLDYENSCVKLGIYIIPGDLLHVICHNPHRMKCDINDCESYMHDFRVHLHP